MKLLLIGGTGILSSATARHAIESGHDVTVVTRGTASRALPDGARAVTADVSQPGALADAVGTGGWDAVVDFIAFSPEHVQRDIDALRDRTGHYVYISSGSVYQPRPMRIPFRESTPLGNPYWAYPAAKLAGERLLQEEYHSTGFPGTIVRPSHTYDETAWPTLGGWTDVQRMKEGSPVLVHGDGTSVRTLTHSSDFARGLVGILGLGPAVGDDFHITSEELLTWNDIYETIAKTVDGTADLVHVASETIVAAEPTMQGPLLGDRAHSKIFDNTKIRTLVPDFHHRVPFSEGARRIHEHWSEQRVLPERDAAYDALTDRMVRFARSVVEFG